MADTTINYEIIKGMFHAAIGDIQRDVNAAVGDIRRETNRLAAEVQGVARQTGQQSSEMTSGLLSHNARLAALEQQLAALTQQVANVQAQVGQLSSHIQNLNAKLP